MITKEITEKLRSHETPFYYYDTEMLHEILQVASGEAANRGFHVHYAVKANFNPVIMKIIAGYGLGADCVSGNEVSQRISRLLGDTGLNIMSRIMGMAQEKAIPRCTCGRWCQRFMNG